VCAIQIDKSLSKTLQSNSVYINTAVKVYYSYHFKNCSLPYQFLSCGPHKASLLLDHLVLQRAKVSCMVCRNNVMMSKYKTMQHIKPCHFNAYASKEWASCTVCRPLTLTWTQNMIKYAYNTSSCLLTERLHQLLCLWHAVLLLSKR